MGFRLGVTKIEVSLLWFFHCRLQKLLTIKRRVTDVMIHQASAQSLAGIPRRGLCRNGQWFCAGMALH